MKLSRPFILLLLSAIVLGIYYPALFAPLCLTDDYSLFVSLTDRKFSWNEIFVPGTVGYYRPLFWVSLWADQILWMFDESFMHLDNMLMHLANVILTFYLALRIQRLYFEKENPMAACAAASVFAVHPLCTESILWIPARVDPMAGIFMLAALIFLFKSLEDGRKMFFVFSALSLFISSLAKEPTVFLAPSFLFISFSYWREKNAAVDGMDDPLPGLIAGVGIRLASLFRWIRNNLFQCVLFSLLPVLYFVMRRIASTQVDKGTATTYIRIVKQITVSKWDPVFISFKSAGFYLKKMFIPWPLNFNIVEVSEWYILLGILLALITIYLLWRSSVISSLIFLSINLIIPAIIVAVAGLGWTMFAERYLYLSIAPLSIAIMLLFQRSNRFEKYNLLLPLAIVAIFAITTVNRNILWTDSLGFYKDCMIKAPNFHLAIKNYAAALAREGYMKESVQYRRDHLPARAPGDLFSTSTNSSSVR